MASSAPKSVFITGTSRGIGLELVKQLVSLSKPPKHIFATCRNPDAAKELQAVASSHPEVHIQKFDTLDYASYSSVIQWVEEILDGDGLNLLINNAAQMHSDGLQQVTRDVMMNELESNAVAPLIISQSFLPLLKKAATSSPISGMNCSKAAIINVTSKMGSIEDNTSGGCYPYRTSKTALNMITKSLSVDLKPLEILAVILHPGWVLTDMGGPNALITLETSVKGIISLMENLKAEDSGTFLNYAGHKIPW